MDKLLSDQRISDIQQRSIPVHVSDISQIFSFTLIFIYSFQSIEEQIYGKKVENYYLKFEVHLSNRRA